MSKRPQLLPAWLGLMVLLWSFNFIVGKLVVREFPPLLASGLRIAAAGALMVPIAALSGRQSLRIERSHRAPLALLGVAGIALNQVLFLVGLNRTSVAHAALIFGLSPILVLVAAAAAGEERLSGRRLAGMLVALAGVAVLHAGSDAASGATLSGDLLVLAGAAAFADFTVRSKPFTARYGAITMNTVGYLSGAVALAPLLVWEARRFAFGQVSAPAWAALAYMAIFPSVVCYLIFYHALRHLAASRIAALAYLQPVLATLMGAALLGERVSGALVAGGVLVLAGVWVAERT